jgi:O-acetylserine/cysteine efflux transporter
MRAEPLPAHPRALRMIAIAPRHVALLVGITFIWGLNLVVSKIGMAEIPPVLFTFLRFAILAAMLAPMLRIHRGQMSALVVAALLSGAISYSLSFTALSRAENVSSIAIAGQLGVPITTLLSVALLGEVVRWRRWTGILLSFAGVFLMGFDPQIGGRWETLALAVGAAFSSALGLIAVKKLHGFSPLELQAWLAWISLPVLFIVSLQVENPDLRALQDVSASAWGTLVFTAVGSSLIAHTGYFYLIQRYAVTSVAPITTLSPVFSIIFSVLLLGDVLTPTILIGGACTLVGVFIITLRERRIVDTGT